jgi:hypothetical protein
VLTCDFSLAQIDDEAIKAFVSNLDASKIDAAPFKGYPLSFPSRFEEVNFIATTQLLNIGSGFREALHSATGRGAWDTIMFGCIGMYLSGRRLDADYFCNITLSDIESTFGIPLSVDKEISGPIKMSVAGPLKPLAQHIYYALTETGRVLRARGFASLGHMIYNVRSKYGESVSVPSLEPITASSLIERLTSAFKPFNDTATTSANSEVCFFKKAQLLCSQLYSRFKVPWPVSRVTVLSSSNGRLFIDFCSCLIRTTIATLISQISTICLCSLTMCCRACCVIFAF